MLHLNHKLGGGNMCAKVDATPGEFRVSYWGVARPARNEYCLAGLEEEGARLCARGSISDFATLVRKSYRTPSDSSVRWYCWSAFPTLRTDLGHLKFPVIPSLQAGKTPRRHADDNDDRRSTT
jgi:hypothetical protein